MALAVSLGCGKRGDPLPPLRRVPDAPQTLRVVQRGDRIELSWVAPARNRDGSLEKIELSEALVLRRVLDLEALVAEQTVLPEPGAPGAESVAGEREAEPKAEPEAEDVAEAVDEPGPPPGVTEPEPEPEAPPGPGEEAAEPGPGAGESESDEGSSGEPPRQRPPLRIPPFAGQAETLATLPAGEPGEAASFGEAVDPEWLGKRVEYAIVYENRNGRRSLPSSIVGVDPIAALSAPAGLDAEAADGFVALRWAEVASEPSGKGAPEAKPLAYALYRRTGASPDFPPTPLHDEPLVALTFEDRTAPFGEEICYAVKTVAVDPVTAPAAPTSPRRSPEAVDDPEAFQEAEARDTDTEVEEGPEPEPDAESAAPARPPGKDVPDVPAVQNVPAVPAVPVVPPLSPRPRIESRPSREVCLTPVDTFPPDAPKDVVAVGTEEGILLSWRESGASDLAGYRVYRAGSPDGPFELLSEEIAVTPSYADATAEPGEAYAYAVTAVDASPSANESSWDEVVEARRPLPR